MTTEKKINSRAKTSPFRMSVVYILILFVLVVLKVLTYIINAIVKNYSSQRLVTKSIQPKYKTQSRSIISPLFCFICCCLCLHVNGQSTPSILDSLNNKKLGEVQVQVQSLAIGRIHIGNNNSSSFTNFNEIAHSIVFTLDYESPEFQNFKIVTQYVGGFSLGRAGNNREIEQLLANGNISVINKFFLQYDFTLFKKQKAGLTIGRKNIDTPFTPSYNIRQKDQSYEALELMIPIDSNFILSLGHIHRFSDWNPDTGFKSISQFLDLPYSTNGIQFLQLNYDNGKRFKWSTYNFFGLDLHNTFGVHTHWKFYVKNDWNLTFKAKYLNQLAVGRYKESVSPIQANVIQTGIKLTIKKISIEPGIFHAFGNNINNTLQTPFQSAIIIKEPLFEIDFGLEGGNTSYFIESSINGKKWNFYGLWLRTQNRINSFTEELDLIVKYTSSSRIYTALKIGLFHSSFSSKPDNYVIDIRTYIGYKF